MSDFHQFGPVTAIPRLVSRDPEEMEQRIEELAKRFPVSLVIPMVPGEMDRTALEKILDELCRVSWVDTLLISLNRANVEDYRRALEYFDRYPGRKVVLWSESPAVSAFVSDMAAAGLYPVSTPASRARGGPAGSPSASSSPRTVRPTSPSRTPTSSTTRGGCSAASCSRPSSPPWTSTSSRPTTPGSPTACTGASPGCC
jgi:hypothetical protein